MTSAGRYLPRGRLARQAKDYQRQNTEMPRSSRREETRQGASMQKVCAIVNGLEMGVRLRAD
jgi:hypothetical protein